MPRRADPIRTRKAHPNWSVFTDELVDSFCDKIEDVRAAALFREMPNDDQLTSIVSGLIGAIIWVMLKSNAGRGDANWEALHAMIELGRNGIREGRPMKQRFRT